MGSTTVRVSFADPVEFEDDALMRNLHRGFWRGLSERGYSCHLWNVRDRRWLALVHGPDDRTLLAGALERSAGRALYRGRLDLPEGWSRDSICSALEAGLRTEIEAFEWDVSSEAET